MAEADQPEPGAGEGAGAAPLLQDLSPEQQRELERRSYVTAGKDLVWREPDGTVRREKLSSLYYVRTAAGVFRVSRLTGQVVEV
jgi:hypothetical protein